jgi:predicted RNA binding protein YcfA (HicA-like mRNA interferase family)
MGTRDFSGEDIYKVLVNVGNFQHVRTTGDHLILK